MPPTLRVGLDRLAAAGRPRRRPARRSTGAFGAARRSSARRILQVGRVADRPGGRSRYRPSVSFSKASCSISVHGRRLGQRHGLALRQLVAVVSRRRTAGPGPRRGRAGAARRARTAASIAAISRGRTLPRRQRCDAVAGASESNAPAFTRLSNTRLLTRRRSRSSQSACSDVIRPCALRTASSDSIAPSPTFLMAVRPKRTPCRRHREPQLALVDVRRQHRDAAVAALAEVQRELVGVLRLDRQQRRREVPRVVRLQVRRLIREERVRRRVRLVEAVPGEVLHQVEDVRGLLLVDARFLRAVHELAAHAWP